VEYPGGSGERFSERWLWVFGPGSRRMQRDARIHAAVDGRHVGNPASAGGIDQLIHRGVDGRDVRRPPAICLLLPELRVAHPAACHQLMVVS